MEQRDFLQRQIEQLGKVLASLFADMLKLQSSGRSSVGIDQVQERLAEEGDIDLEKMIALNEKDLKTYMAKRHLTDEHLDTMAGFLEELGQDQSRHNPTEALRIWEYTLKMLANAEKASNTTSFTRVNRVQRIQRLIGEVSGEHD